MFLIFIVKLISRKTKRNFFDSNLNFQSKVIYVILLKQM